MVRLENLMCRFEEPSSMVRWDSPLFTVTWSDENIPEELWNAVTSGFIKSPNRGTVPVTHAPTNALQDLERITSNIIGTIMNLQAMSGATAGEINLNASQLSVRVTLPARRITLAELQRARRQFVTLHKKAIALGSVERGTIDWDERCIAYKFIEYLEEHVMRKSS
ncbi:hypothetical protein AX17_004772 [Amanita inopinata Kibby_2008]|nr:hypothetical protein AX17_004772 [Amanita inopinata Kibby_2008]